MNISKMAKRIMMVSMATLLAVLIIAPLISSVALAADMAVTLSDPTASGINESTRKVLYNTDSNGTEYNLYLDSNEFKIDYTPTEEVDTWLSQLRSAYYKSFSKKLYGEQRSLNLTYLDYGHAADAQTSEEQTLIESGNASKSGDEKLMYSGNYYYITSNVWNTGTLYNPATGEAYEKTSAEKEYKYLDIEQVNGEYKPVISNQPQMWRIIAGSNVDNNVNYSFIYVGDDGSEDMALTLIENIPSEEIFQEYSFTVTGLGDTSSISTATMSTYNKDGTNLGVLKVQSAGSNSNDYAVMEIADGVLTVTITSDVVTGIILNVKDDNYSTENTIKLQQNDVKKLSTAYEVQSDGTLLATGETVVTSITQPIEGAETTYELTLTEWTGTPTSGQLFSSDRNVSVSESKGYSMVHLHSALYTAKYLNASGIKNITSGQIIEGVTGIENAPRDVTAGNFSNNHSYNWYFTYADSPYTPFPEVKYTWASSDPEIADINDAGYVRIYQPGSVRFTCTASVDTGLTAVSQKEIGTSPLLEREFYVDYQFTEQITGTKENPLTDIQDTENFPGENKPGSVTIDKSANTNTTDYYENGVANVKLEADGLVASEPVDVILVIDASRSMTDFWSEDYDLVFCAGTRTETYINDGKTIISADYDDGTRDITYYVEDGALFDANNDPISGTYIDVKDMSGNVVAYIYHDSDASTFYLYDTDQTTVLSQTVPSDRTLRDAEDLVLTLNDVSYYGEQGTASDEFIMNYDKMEAARESAATFVNTILDANPSSRIALVQFANDEVKNVSETTEPETWQADDANYYQINSRVICDYTSDRKKLLGLISNKAAATENRYAQEGAGSGYYRYGPSIEEIEANDIEAKALTSGLVLSNKGGTNYGLAFQYAEEAANRDIANANTVANDRQIVVFMTDGEPNYLNLGTNSFFPNDQDEYLNNMRDATGSKDSSSWSYFALRTQLQDRLDLEKLGYEVISVGFDLDSDGTGYFAPYTKSAVDDNDNLVEGEPVYSLDINEKTYDFDTSLWEDLGEDSSTTSYDLLIEMRKRVVKDIASYENGYYAVDEYNDDGTPNYDALNEAYEDVANSMIFKTTDAVVTDVIGDDYELRLLPFNNNGTTENPQIVITSADINITNTYTDSNGNVTHYDTELDTESAQVIETITFTGSTLKGGITVEDRYLDEEGNWQQTTYTFNSLPYTINGHYVTYDSSSKKFTWTIGEIVNQHFELSYDAYLTGSDPAYELAMGRTDASWLTKGADTAFAKAAAVDTLATNKEATILYKNYNKEYCKQTYNVPKLDWKTTSVTATKKWDDKNNEGNNNEGNNRPAAVYFQLQKSYNGGAYQNVFAPKTLTADDWDNNRVVTWADLPINENGYDITYKVVEVVKVVEVDDTTIYEDGAPVGYTVEVTGSAEDGFTVTNKLNRTSVTVTKDWEDGENVSGFRPQSITVYLKNGDSTLQSYVLRGDGDSWTYTFENLPEYLNGAKANYTVDEETVSPYSKVITGDAATGYTITNSYTPEYTDVTVIKTWDDNNNYDGFRPDEITVTLKANGEVKETVNLSGSTNSWTYKWENLPKHANGELIEYTVEEQTDYTHASEYNHSEPVENPDYTFAITNTHGTEYASVPFVKIWDDAGDQDGKRPDSIKVHLTATAGGSKVSEYCKDVTLTEADVMEGNSDRWVYTWNDLPKYYGGQEITYTVSEDTVPGYDITSVEGYTITNSYTPATTDISVEKDWVDANNQDGLRQPISVTLYKQVTGGEKTAVETVQLNASADEASNWKHKWTKVPVYDGGKEITYTVEESNVPTGYETDETGNVDDGFTITNTHTPETIEIPVTKIWDDNNDQDGMRPKTEGVAIKIVASVDGEVSEKYSKQVTLTAANAVEGDSNKWTYTFTGLPKYAEGSVAKPVTYTVQESSNYTNASEYTSSGPVRNEDGSYTITNTHEPETTYVSVSKKWEDAQNNDNIRPPSVTVYLTGSDGSTRSVELHYNNSWSYTFADLPEYSAGQKITYTLSEEKVEGYNTEIENGVITNTHEPETIDITVNKAWEDNGNLKGVRPEKISIYVMDGETVVRTVELTEDGGWTAQVTGLPKYSKGTLITYIVKEVSVPSGYNSTPGSVGNSYTVTNTLECFDVTVNYVDTNGNSIYIDAERTQIFESKTPYDDVPKGNDYNVRNVGDEINDYRLPVIETENGVYVYTSRYGDPDADALDGNKDITYVYTLYQDPTVSKAVNPTIINVTADGAYTVTYTITVTNTNRFPLSDVVITDTIPEGMTDVKVNGTAVTGNAISTTVDVPAATDDAAGTASVTVTAVVNGWTRVNEDPGQEDDTDATDYSNIGDYAFTAGELTIYAGQSVSNEVIVPVGSQRRVFFSNMESSVVSVSQLDDTTALITGLSDGTGWISAVSLNGEVCYCKITVVSKWSYANTAQIDKIKMDPDNDGTATEIDYTEPDEEPIKSNTVHTDVYLDPTIEKWIIDGTELVKSSTIAVSDENGTYQIIYRLVITNPNNISITNVAVSDVLPEGLSYVAPTTVTNGEDYDAATRTVSWVVPSITAGGTATVQFTAQLSESVLGSEAAYINQAQINRFTIDTPNNDPVTDTSVIPSDKVVTDIYRNPTINKYIVEDDDRVQSNVVYVIDESGTYYVDYELVVSNPNDFALTNVTVNDVCPNGLSFVSAQPTADNTNGTLTWSGLTVPASGQFTITARFRIDDANASMDIALGDTAPYRNKAVITGLTVDPDGTGSSQPGVPDIPAENVAVKIPSNEVITNVYKDPTITKVVEGGKDRFSVGQTVEYTITVTNEGGVPIYKLPVTDTLPQGMSFAQNSDGNSVTLSVSSTPAEYQNLSTIEVEDTTINAYIACLNPGATATIKVWAKISDGSFGTYDNIATLEEAYLNYTDEDPYVEDLQDNVVIDTVVEPYIEKSVDKAAAAKGETLTYTIKVFNPTVEDIFDTVVTDTLPEGLTCTADNYDAATRTLTWTDIDIASGAHHTITFTAVVENVDDYNKYENIAYLKTVKLDKDGDGDLDEETYTDKFDKAETKPLRDPVIVKSDDKDYVREGDEITYTITVLNPNEFDLLNVEVSDPLPAGVKLIDEDGKIAENEGGTLEWTIGRIPAAVNGQPGRWSTEVKVSVSDRADAIYYNTAYIDSAVIDLDGDGVDDTTSTTDPGDYPLEYENDPTNRTGENASETVEADVYYELTVEFREYDTTAENDHGSEIADSIGKNDYKNGNVYHVNDIQANAIPNIIIDQETGEIWVKKLVSDKADPVTETINRADRTVVVLYEQYDSLFTLNKQVTTTPTDEASWTDEITVLPGTTVYFRIAVTNLVNYPITGLDLSDELVYNAYEPTLPENWSGLLNAFSGELAANETWTSQHMEMSTTGAHGGDRYVNTATVADDVEGTPDLIDDAKVNIIGPGALTLTKTANVTADETTGVKYVAPGRVSFTIQVTNTGESVLKDVQIVDDSYDVILVDAETGAETIVPKGTVIKTIETLAVGGTDSVNVNIVIPEETPNGQSIQNFATATGKDQNGSDVEPSTDDDTVVVTKAVEPVLSIVKTVNNTDARENPLVVAPGEALVYTITITNSSDVDAEDVYVLDYMHVGGTKLTDEWAIDKGWVIDVPKNSSVTIEDVVCSTIMPMAPAGTVINNVVELYESEKSYTDGEEPIDDDIAKVKTDALYTINVVKTADVAVHEPGDTAEFVIYVTNTGNTVLTDILVTDALAGVWGELPTETEDKAEVTVTRNEDNTLTIDTLQPEDCVRLTFSYDIAADVEVDTITNTVTAESETPDGDEVTGEDDEVVTIFRNQLNIEKTALVGSAAPGSTVQFLVTVTNTGDSVLNNVIVTDDLEVTVVREQSAVSDSDLVDAEEPSAENLEELGVDTDEYEGTVIGFYETLEPDEVRFIYVDYVIPEDAEDGDTVYNNATAEADGGHEDTAGDDVDVVVPVVEDYRMTVTKTANLEQVKPGQTVLYTITVTNIGASDLTNVVITDSLPVVYNGTTYAAGQPIKTITLLESGQSESVTVSYTVPENSTAMLLDNTATADSTETQPITDKVTVIVKQPSVSIKKTVNTQNATAGQKVYYTITVTNTGNCTLTNLLVSDSKIGYSYTISELKAGKSWTSPSGELYYTFGSGVAIGSTFVNNASVSNEEVKGANDTTTTTVTTNPNDYKGPNTGDDSMFDEAQGENVRKAWSAAVSAGIICSITAVIIIRRRRSRTAN